MTRILGFSVLVLLLASGTAALGEDVQGQITDLQNQLKELKQRLDNIDKKTDSAKPIAGWDGKFFIQSSDGEYRANIGACAHFDGRFPFNGPSKSNDQFLFRRVRLYLEGYLARYYEFKVEADIGAAAAKFTDVFVNWHYFDEFQVKAGQFKVPFSVEELTSENTTRFIEKSVVDAFAPGRRLGVMVGGKPDGSGLLDYGVGMFNGRQPGSFMPAGRLVLDLASRQELGLLHNFSIGANAALDHDAGAVIGGDKFETGMKTKFFEYAKGAKGDTTDSVYSNGNRLLQGADLSFWRGPFGFITEYVVSEQNLAKAGSLPEKIKNQGWYAQASYVLTGEEATAKGVKPKKDFDLSKGTWGAFEVAARYAVLNIDDKAFTSGFAAQPASTDGAKVTTAGLNWYLSKHVRIMVDFEHAQFASALKNGDKGENGIMTRVQFAF